MELPPDFVLRAGRGDGSAPPDPQFILGVTSTLCVFCEAAMREAGEYAVAAGRRSVAAEDMALAMKAQAVPSGGFWENPDLAQQYTEHRNGLLEEFARGDDSSEEEAESQSEEEAEAEEAWTRAPAGASPLVDRMHAAEDEFESWRPSDPLEVAVRNAIIAAGGV